MADSVACDRCAKSVKPDDDVIQCMGFCNHVCHVRCANLNGPLAKVLREKSNLFWMCDECVKLMKFCRFKDVVSSLGNVISTVVGHQQNSVLELKDEIVRNNRQVAQLTNKINAATPLQTRNLDRPSKRRRGDTVTPSKPITGTRVVTNNDTIVACPPPNLFWVYLSRFHPSVKMDVVEKLVRDGLQTRDTIRVVSLVKKGTDLSTLNFVSFKVGVPMECRSAALNPSSWPQGIVFRAFEDTQTKSTVWLPSTEPTTTPAPGLANDCAAGPSVDTPKVPASPAPFGSQTPLPSNTPVPIMDTA